MFSPDKKNKQLKREGYRDRKCVLGIELFVMHREYSEITENIVFNRETKELSLGAKSLLVWHRERLEISNDKDLK